jgi:hypothetical protein
VITHSDPTPEELQRMGRGTKRIALSYLVLGMMWAALAVWRLAAPRDKGGFPWFEVVLAIAWIVIALLHLVRARRMMRGQMPLRGYRWF